MNKKFLSAILFGALMVTSTGTFVSCKDYDEDIDSINKELADIKSQIASLQSQVNSGNYVTGVTKAANGITFTFSNGSPVTIEIKDGAAGATGAAGKDGSIVEVKEGVLYIDGEATEIKVCETPVVEEGEFLPAVAIVDGEWAVLQEDGSYLSTGYAASSVAVAENEKGGYTLTIKDAEGEETEIELPATKVITDLKATSIDATGKMGDANVTLYYGMKITADKGLSFNGKTYAKGQYLLSQTAKLSAIVNPLDADATKYAYKLVDTKGNAPIVVSDIKQNMSEKALSRAEATANQGVWDMTLSFADATNVKATGVYALTAETVNGVVASPYDVKVTSEAAPTNITPAFTAVEGNYNTEIDLTKAFYEDTSNEWKKYIVDYYFEIADATAAAAAGISIVDGDKVVCTTNKTADYTNVIKVNYLLVNGQPDSKNVTVKVKYVAPTTQLANVEWTINKDNKIAYVSLSAIQAQLAGATDAQLPSYAATGKYTWADGEELDKKSVVVNGAYYGADVTGKNPTKFANLNKTQLIASLGTSLYVKNDQGKYVAAGTTNKIQDELFMQLNFNEKTAFPGEFVVYVGFKKYGDNVNALEAPVYVTIKAPTQTIVKYENYFNGDDAVAYGTADYQNATYDLNNLFKTTGLTFTETAVKKNETTNYAMWLQGDGHTVKVPAYRYGTNVDNTVSVGSTHEYVASIIPFNNQFIQKTEYKFNLTVKSAINEGEFSSVASKSIETSEPVEFLVSDFTAVDVFGDKFYIANTYKKSGDNWVADKSKDARIENIIIEAGDDNATNYLSIDPAFSGTTPNAKGSQTFKVARKQGLTQLVADTECKVNVTVEDKWGVKTTATVTVVLKKFGN